MSDDDRELAHDCWKAAAMLRHPSVGDAEVPEWVAATALQLQPPQLGSVQGLRLVVGEEVK